ncbi:MAG: ABC transporter permease [Acidobacteriota bacterium]
MASGDREFLACVSASVKFSAGSSTLASIAAVPLGVGLATTDFRGKRLVVDVLKTLLSVPTVAVGLFVYAIIFSQGPMGGLHLLFTPGAIVIGQTVLILPLITTLTYGAVAGVDPLVRGTAQTLGAGRWRTLYTVAREARAAILIAVVTGFGRVFGEVGISMLLGGNIAGYTRTITTAIALETSKGEFALGMALGLVLLFVSFCLNIAIRLLGGARQ